MLARLPFSEVCIESEAPRPLWQEPTQYCQRFAVMVAHRLRMLRDWFPKRRSPSEEGLPTPFLSSFAAVEGVYYLHCEGTYLALMVPSVAGATSGAVEPTTSWVEAQLHETLPWAPAASSAPLASGVSVSSLAPASCGMATVL